MSNLLKLATAVVVSFGPFVSQTDGVTLKTGLVSAIDHATTGIFLSKNGGALTIRHQAVTASTYDAYGNYRVTLDATDTGTLGTLRVQFADATTNLVVWQDFMVVTANMWNSLMGANGAIPDAVAGAANGLFIAGTNAATVITGSLTTTFTGNLTGSVGSESGTIVTVNVTTNGQMTDVI